LKGNVKRIVSGLLSAVTVLFTFLQPVAVYTTEQAAYEAEYPVLEKVRARLNGGEIVSAEDYSVEFGSDFDGNLKSGIRYPFSSWYVPPNCSNNNFICQNSFSLHDLISAENICKQCISRLYVYVIFKLSNPPFNCSKPF